MADDFQREIGFLGMISSPAFVRQPEGNGVAERSIRTLKEQLLWVRHFATIEELRLELETAVWRGQAAIVACGRMASPLAFIGVIIEIAV